MATGQRVDPYRGFNFLVEIDGITQAGFQEVDSLDSSTDPLEYREGADPNHARKLPALNKFSAITIKRGVTDSDQLWTCRATADSGTTQRKNGSRTFCQPPGSPKTRSNLPKRRRSK